MTARKRVPSPRRSTGIALAVLVVAAALAGGGWYWHHAQQYRNTENAYVNAKIVQVSSLVMGQVSEVPVHENDYVHAGDVLFQLDARPFQAALDEALGKLRQAEQGTRQDSSELLATEADAARASSELGNAESNLRRTTELVRQNFMSKQAADDAQARVAAAHSALAAARARADKARAALAQKGGETPAVRVAQAEVDKARLDLEHAVMRAPADGWVTRFDLTRGTVVTPGNPLFALVEDHSFWVDANFKETELEGVTPGRPATIAVDMYPGHAFHGRVESLAGGTGAAFSLLPAQNANGNWVKIAQRIPVRVSIADADPAYPLRVGATASVTVALVR